MGQKVHPYGFRLGYTKTWRSRWFATKNYGELLQEDLRIKRNLKERFFHPGISSIEIERAANNLTLVIRTSRPGIVIGRKGSEIDRLKLDLEAATGRDVFINIQEIHKPELDAQLVAESIAQQLIKRVAFRRAMGIRETMKRVVTGGEGFKELLDEGLAGDKLGLLLRGTGKDDVERGQVVAQTGTITPHTKFRAEAYILTKEEGGRHTPFFKGYPTAVLLSDNGCQGSGGKTRSGGELLRHPPTMRSYRQVSGDLGRPPAAFNVKVSSTHTGG